VKLREYQAATIEKIVAALRTDNRTAVVLATGLGKTVIFSYLAALYHRQGQRVLVLVHREELALQAAEKLAAVNPLASIGIVKAERDEWQADIVVASVPTLASAARRRRIPADNFDLIVADECHHAAAASWQKVLTYFGAYAETHAVGFTATMSRGDAKKLGDTWPNIAAQYGIEYGISNGYLVPVSGIRIRVRNLMLERVKTARGDLATGDLGAAMIDADAGSAIVDAYRQHADSRPAALFLPDVSTVTQFSEYLNDAGVPTAYVVGETTTVDRQRIYADFRSGKVKILASCMVLTEGWDMPSAEVAIMGRPTKNSVLYTQCVGRVLRPSPETGKTSALVIDLVGVTDGCSLATLVDLFPPDKKLYPEGDEPPERKPKSPPLPTEVTLKATGDIVSQHVELLAGSPARWLQSRHGIFFIPISDNRRYYLWCSGEAWGVGLQDKTSYLGGKKKFGHVLAKGLSFEAAKEYAEKEAIKADPSLSQRTSAWRSRPVREGMANYARRLRMPIAGYRQGTVSDMIAVHEADRYLPEPK
jgi:superfamily II DNA or RNA helicase